MKDTKHHNKIYLSGYLHFNSIALQYIAWSNTQTIYFNRNCSLIFKQRSSTVITVLISVAGESALLRYCMLL